MKRGRDLELERNQKMVSLADFMEAYNHSIPDGFPRASARALKRFQASYPILFRGAGEFWSIERHRKRLMDWLLTHTDAV